MAAAAVTCCTHMYPREPASSVRHIRAYGGPFGRAAQAARMLNARLRVVPTARSAPDNSTFMSDCRKPSLLCGIPMPSIFRASPLPSARARSRPQALCSRRGVLGLGSESLLSISLSIALPAASIRNPCGQCLPARNRLRESLPKSRPLCRGLDQTRTSSSLSTITVRVSRHVRGKKRGRHLRRVASSCFLERTLMLHRDKESSSSDSRFVDNCRCGSSSK
jgi:hypothetical protein